MKVLIIAPHPDDEVLGCGGTILRHVKRGDEVVWVIVTSVSVEDGFTVKRVESRNKEIELVKSKFGFTKTYQLGFPTTRLNEISERKIIDAIRDTFIKEEPEVIYLPNRSDVHSDHRIVFEAVMACTKSFRYPFIREILMYESLSETEFSPALPEKVFVPNCFVDISSELKQKIEIMKIYKSELGNHPFPRSVENLKALATYRGAVAGVKYAEAFQLIKSLRIEHLS